MKKKYVFIISILLIICITGGLLYSNYLLKRIVLSQEVKNSISLSDISLHVDQLLENGFDYDGFYEEADLYTYRHSSRGVAQLFLYPSKDNNSGVNSQPEIHIRRIEYRGDNCIYIFINDPNAGKLRMWIDYDENGKMDTETVNKILLELFTKYSLNLSCESIVSRYC